MSWAFPLNATGEVIIVHIVDNLQSLNSLCGISLNATKQFRLLKGEWVSQFPLWDFLESNMNYVRKQAAYKIRYTLNSLCGISLNATKIDLIFKSYRLVSLVFNPLNSLCGISLNATEFCRYTRPIRSQHPFVGFECILKLKLFNLLSIPFVGFL
jgi:hypothetical protein